MSCECTTTIYPSALLHHNWGGYSVSVGGIAAAVVISLPTIYLFGWLSVVEQRLVLIVGDFSRSGLCAVDRVQVVGIWTCVGFVQSGSYGDILAEGNGGAHLKDARIVVLDE